MNKTISVGIVSVVVGFLLGYGFFGTRPYPTELAVNNHADHMGMMMNDMSASLEGKTGSEFDKAFLDQMIVHHEGAVVMAQQVLSQSQRPELLALAKEIIAAQTKEIDMMKGWRGMWFVQ